MATICSCIKGNYDFLIVSSDTQNLVYQDLSDWMTGDHYVIPTEYFVEIIPPGRTTGVQVTVDTGCSTRINRDDTNFRFKDGVYCFIVDSCGKKYIKSIGVFSEIECCIKKAKVTKPHLTEELLQIENKLEALKHMISTGYTKDASSSLQIIENNLRNIKCDCDCSK